MNNFHLLLIFIQLVRMRWHSKLLLKNVANLSFCFLIKPLNMVEFLSTRESVKQENKIHFF